MHRPLVTVIVPLYKTEPFVKRCIDSIFSQSLQNIEIIAVDDCSPDGSAAVVQDLANSDERLRLIRHERNLGLGGARNTGIRAATAPLIASVDSDDYISSNMLEVLYREMQAHDADVVACGYTRVAEDGRILSRHGKKSHTIDRTASKIDIFRATNPAFWNKLWQRSLYVDNNIFFPNHVYYQDLATTPRILTKVRRLRTCEEQLYSYAVRNDSITLSKSDKHIDDYGRVFGTLRDFLIEENVLDSYAQEFYEMTEWSTGFHAKNVLDSHAHSSEAVAYVRRLAASRLAALKLPEYLESLPIDAVLRLISPQKPVQLAEQLPRGSTPPPTSNTNSSTKQVQADNAARTESLRQRLRIALRNGNGA